MGRPNCSRTLACSAAVCSAQAAVPQLSAANSTPARSRTRSLSTSSSRSPGTGTPSRASPRRSAGSGRRSRGRVRSARRRRRRARRCPCAVSAASTSRSASRAGQDGRRGAVQDIAVGVRDGGERARCRGRRRRCARRRRGPVRGPAPPPRCSSAAARAVRQIRAGQRGAARLLQDDGEVEQFTAPAAVRLGQMQPEQALCGELVPVGGPPAAPRGAVSSSLRTSSGGTARAAHPRTASASSRCSCVIPMPMRGRLEHVSF